jgi:hypothetical protein
MIHSIFYESIQDSNLLLDGLTVIKVGNKEATRCEHCWYDTNPEFSEYLRMWGEVGTVKLKTNSTPQIGDRGIQHACLLDIIYSLDHTADCYEMWDPATSRIHQTRDVIWFYKTECITTVWNRLQTSSSNHTPWNQSSFIILTIR